MLPSGFEPESKPREGFMIGRYTTGATFLGKYKLLIKFLVSTIFPAEKPDEMGGENGLFSVIELNFQ